MPREHTMSCDFPEGCNCGAAEWNQLEEELKIRTRQRDFWNEQRNIELARADRAEALLAVTAEERDRCARRAGEARDMLVRADAALETYGVSKLSPVRANIASTLGQ